MQSYRIEVQRGSEWRERTVLEANSRNNALREYGLKGSRPYNGHARSLSGKTFRAINLG